MGRKNKRKIVLGTHKWMVVSLILCMTNVNRADMSLPESANLLIEELEDHRTSLS